MDIHELKQGTAAPATAKAQHPAISAITNALPAIKAVLPAHITADRMAKLALGVLRTHKKLATAARLNPASFANAIMDASRLGLEPGFDAHLVPYENKRQGTAEIQMIPDYRGLLALARRSGEITSVMVQVVYANDVFDLEMGLQEKLVHKPALHGARGDPVLVYGVARFRDGSHHVEWMTREEVDAIRARSQAYRMATQYQREDTPWIADYTEMMRKTLVRRMCKYLPRSIELANAERLMDAAEAGVPAHFDGDFVIVEEADDEAPAQEGSEAESPRRRGRPPNRPQLEEKPPEPQPGPVIADVSRENMAAQEKAPPPTEPRARARFE